MKRISLFLSLLLSLSSYAANDSKTMVYIERGSMLTEVKKKLSATSSYDIVTPNTTMSIRGTKTLTQ